MRGRGAGREGKRGECQTLLLYVWRETGAARNAPSEPRPSGVHPEEAQWNKDAEPLRGQFEIGRSGLRPLRRGIAYYDLFHLSGHPEVETMLRSAEYAVIKTDYDQISRSHFSKSYFFPEGMSFGRSDALFPSPELAAVIGPQYETHQILCYGHYPSWADVQVRFKELRNIL